MFCLLPRMALAESDYCTEAKGELETSEGTIKFKTIESCQTVYNSVKNCQDENVLRSEKMLPKVDCSQILQAHIDSEKVSASDSSSDECTVSNGKFSTSIGTYKFKTIEYCQMVYKNIKNCQDDNVKRYQQQLPRADCSSLLETLINSGSKNIERVQ